MRLGREVSSPRPRLRPRLVVGLFAVMVVAAGVSWRSGRMHCGKRVGWYAAHRAQCNPLEVDVVLRDAGATAVDRAMCFAVAGRITQAHAILDAMSAPDRDAALTAVFALADPIAQAGDDRSAGPIMGLVVEYQPDNMLALFHAGIAEAALGHDQIARAHLRRFLALYAPEDSSRARAEAALAELDAPPEPVDTMQPD